MAADRTGWACPAQLVPYATVALYSSVSLDSAIEQLYHLNPNVVGQGDDRHESPHKPVMLLAALELMDKGADTSRVAWSNDLRGAFKRIFTVVKTSKDKCSPENPFFYLDSTDFWSPVFISDGKTQPLRNKPRVMDIGEVFADLSPGFTALLTDRHSRQSLRDALIDRYFSEHRRALLGPAVQPPCAADEPARYGAHQPGRSAAFRKIVIEIYGYRCAACGLELGTGSLPLGLVEAAHLVPFSESRNDHPTNGMALCKNHHWAMDSHLIAPSTDGVWHRSRRLIPHRSRGEQELAELDGRQVIPPVEQAFRPARQGLEWRCAKMEEQDAAA